jgi:hypothetical protein
MTTIKEGLQEQKQEAQARLEGWEIVERLIDEAKLSHEEETRVALAIGGIHPAILSKRLGDEAKSLSLQG